MLSKSQIGPIKKSQKNEQLIEEKQKDNQKKAYFLKRATNIRDKESQNIMKNLHKKDSIYILEQDLESQIKQLKREEHKNKRSLSNNIDNLKVERYINKKKIEYEKITVGRTKTQVKTEYFSNMLLDCVLYDKNDKKFKGKLFIDKSYVINFSSEMHDKSLAYNDIYYFFPLFSIAKCVTTNKDCCNYCKEITLKDYRNFIFKFSEINFRKFSEIIDKFALPSKSESYFNYAFSYKNSNIKHIKFNVIYYDFLEEFKRQGIDFNSNKQFRILNNSDFKFCESYPKKIIVPYDMPNEYLKKCAEFRTKNRIPILTYRHKNGNCIWRSSQTRGGFKSTDKFDIILISKIANNKKLFVFDARPYLNAVVNKFKGAGFEKINDYKGNNIDIDILFCGIPNIHEVRNSYQKMMTTISLNIEDSPMFANISNTKWYESITLIIKSSFQIYDKIMGKNNILIHCSDGWDRTSQLSSMSQILLDPYYRTIDGLICLIEKDWKSCGHQFRYRNNMYSPMDCPPKVNSEIQFSPIFLQWLDALYQVMEQNYKKFQYNFDLLIFLAEEMNTGKFGTFLFNNDKEREYYGENNKTISIWNYVKTNEDKYINKIYDKNDGTPLCFNSKLIKIWEDYFYKFVKRDSSHYLEEYNKKIKDIERKAKDDNSLIQKLCNLIAKKYTKEEFDKFDREEKRALKLYFK